MKKLTSRLFHPIKRLPFDLAFSLSMLCVNLLPKAEFFDRLRFILLRIIGVRGEGRFTILSPVEISPYCAQSRISISGPSFINSGVRFAVPPGGKITIEKNVAIGPRVQFECMNHGVNMIGDVRVGAHAGSIYVENGAWIGARVIILGDVRIGRGAVIAAGSVVNRDVAAYTLVAGVPARFKKHLGIDNDSTHEQATSHMTHARE